ncbi:MAG: hypothetical protein PHE78_07840, partial [Candidatus Gastranaerophilales bacterium]|nr:hypothetical protein [Candidatus Gastranaerophilales bacterium]
MKDFWANILQIIKNHKKVLILSVFFVFAVWFYIFQNSYYVIVRFNELGPVSKNMAAYYNGFKIGKIVKIKPDADFKHTLVRVNLIAQGLNLPQNTTVHVKSFPTGELYLEFIYPPNPSLRSIRRGEVLEGISPYSIEEFMLGQNISGVTDVVSIHVIKALQATEIANIEMKNFFENTSSVIKDNKEGINASVDNTVAMTKSLAEMAENLNQAAQKINNSIDSQSIRESTSNIKDSSL